MDFLSNCARIVRLAAAALFSMAAASAAVSGADSDVWQYTHPQAKALIGVDWQGASRSHLGLLLATELKKLGLKPVQEMNILDDLDSVLISSPGKPDPKSKQEPPVIIAAKGRFNIARVKASMAEGYSSSRFRGVEMLVPPRSKHSDMQVAVVNPGLLLIGDRMSLRALLTRGPGEHAGGMYDRARKLSAANDIWAVLDIPPSTLLGDGVPQAAFLKNVESLDLGISLKEGLGINLFLNTASKEDAATMSQALSGLLALGLMQNTDPKLNDLARNIHISPEGKALKLLAAIGKDELTAGIQRAAVSFRPGKWKGQQARPVQRAQNEFRPPAPRRRMVVRIEGLADGPREIPYGRP